MAKLAKSRTEISSFGAVLLNANSEEEHESNISNVSFPVCLAVALKYLKQSYYYGTSTFKDCWFSTHLEISQLMESVNQLIGFYMMEYCRLKGKSIAAGLEPRTT